MSTTSRALACAALWFDAATVDRVFAPLVADWQREWLDASSAQRSWIVTRGAWWFGVTFLLMWPEAVLRAPAPRGVLRRVAIRITIFMVVTCGIMATLVATDAGNASSSRVAWLLLLLLPSFIAFAFPFAVAFIVDIVRPRPETSAEQRALMAKLAIAFSLFVFAFAGWVVPRANQMVRIETRGYDIPAPYKGVRELTTSELVFNAPLTPEREPYTGLRDRERRVRAEIQNRIYVVALPVLLIWLRWTSLARPQAGWLPLPAALSAFLSVITVTALYFGCWIAERTYDLPVGTSSWLSLGALGAWGLATPFRQRIVPHAIDLMARLYQGFQNSRIA